MTIEARLHRSVGALTMLTNGRHVWNADLPQNPGSHAMAPDPHDLLDSALAACTAMTLELYLRRQQWSVSSLQISIERLETRGSDGKIGYHLQRQIFVVGELSESQRERLFEIASKCPIHKVLEGTVSINTQLS